MLTLFLMLILNHIITDNFFDGYTVDGSNEDLIKGTFSQNTIYKNNTNQTGYLPIQKAPYVVSSQISDPPDPAFKDIVEYTDLSIPLNNISIPLGQIEGIIANYNNSFAKVGGCTTMTGSTTITCNFAMGGAGTLQYGTVRFDDGSYYEMQNGSSAGPTATVIIIPTPYDGPTHVSAAVAKFYNAANGQTPLQYAGLPPATPTATFSILMDLNEMLPPNVQIISCVVGLSTTNASNIVGGGYTLDLFASNTANYNLASLAGSMADVHNFIMPATSYVSSNITIGNGAGQIPPNNFSSSTQYLTIDLTSPANASIAPLFVTGKNRKIPALYAASLTVNAGSQNYMQESPLIVKYRWL